VPYFVELTEMRVVVRPRRRAPVGRQELIDTDTAILCDLDDGQILSNEQLDALRNRSVTSYQTAAPPIAPQIVEHKTTSTASAIADEQRDITNADVRQEARRQNVVHSAQNLNALCELIGAVFVVLGVLGVVAGIVIARSEATVVIDSLRVVRKRQNVGIGVVVAIGSAVQAGLIVIFTRAAGLFATYTLFQAERN
jgi:hypothetical protein